MPQRIRKGDLVVVIAGADKGKQGRVLAIDTARGRVRVEKIRVQKRHLKAGPALLNRSNASPPLPGDPQHPGAL